MEKAGGSALSGEKPLECAIKELWEETRIIFTELIEGLIEGRIIWEC